MDIDETKKSLLQVIDALLDCENKGKDCRKCPRRRTGCLLFIRDSVAVALQFIVAGLDISPVCTSMYV